MNHNPAKPVPIEARASFSSVHDFVELSKPRIAVMVLLTVAVAGLVSLPATGSSGWLIVHAMLGLLLITASGCALNQYLERYTDFLMPRTCKRPLPDFRLSAFQVASFGAITFGMGVAWLLALVNWQTAAMAAGSWFLYVWVYTPMKLRTWLNTYVGAVAGAMPILVGSTAVCQGAITWTAFLLFSALYIWQFPHFMAIAWLYREDYQQASIKMASTVGDGGRLAGRHAVIFAVLQIAVTVVALWPTGIVSGLLLAVVIALGLWYLAASIVFYKNVNDQTARRLFRVSLIYLPAYLVVLSIASLY